MLRLAWWEVVNCSTRAELKCGLKISLRPQKEKNRSLSRPGEVFCSLFPCWNAPSPQFSWSNAQAPWTHARQAISVTSASSPADTATACEGHPATVAQNPDLKWAAPTSISQVPGRPQTCPVPFYILVARRMSHCRYNYNWDMSIGAFISPEIPSRN